MEFMLLFLDRRGAEAEVPGEAAAMREIVAGLANEGKFRRGAPLAAESAAVRVRVRGGKAFVTDGPFAETREVLVGFWVVDVASREEAIGIARRSPHAAHGIVEVHRVLWRDAAASPAEGTPVLLAFRVERGLTDPDGAKMREMIAFGDALKRDGKLLETAPLAKDPPPARVETRAGKVLVTDGPFAESKEAVGGYSLVCVAGREEAIELAKRYPHARWGPVEVRELELGVA